MFDVRVVPIKVLNDNYVWLIIKNNQAIAIDVGDEKEVVDYLKNHELDLVAVFTTHHHEDHVGGVFNIKQLYPHATIYTHHSHVDRDLVEVECDEGFSFELLGLTFNVWRTAGHTDTHLTYLCKIDDKTHVFCGDTLFSGGCGRVFTGTMQTLFDSVMRINALPEDTILYPSHEYTNANLKFGLLVCPTANKEFITQYKNKINQQLKNNIPSLPTDLKTERLINVFLQTDHPEIMQNIQRIYPLKGTDSFSVFSTLRELKNKF